MISCDRLTVSKPEVCRITHHKTTIWGIMIALFIISLWAGSLTFLFHLDLTKLPIGVVIIASVWQTFLYTGLFITAHDAMHGSIYPQNRKLNHWIGRLSAWLYGCFSYSKLLQKHGLHHHHPATELDPDYDENQSNFGLVWYFHFMKRYMSWRQYLQLNIGYFILHYLAHVSPLNLCLFWVLPPIVSSLQLFYFGTFLPHREPDGGYQTTHRASTIALPIIWSFLACYHFGYHQEHHECPNVPWWKLPLVYQQRINHERLSFSH